jgi:mannan endo-1,4-beta-mannosidase
MRKFLLLFFLLLTTEIPALLAQSSLQVKGRFLVDPKGKKIILRGVNEMFIWSKTDLTGDKTLPEIAKTGANVVRLAWLSAEDNPRATAANLDALISNCIAAGMIPMPELHGATGKWEKLQKQVDYWVSPEVLRVLKKHESYLLVNIANEAGDRTVTDDQFKAGYGQAIGRLRQAGLRCPLVIDGANWGQSIDILQANASYLINQDPLQNLLFSVHMWWTAPDGATERIKQEIQESVALNLPLIVGEFAPMGVGCARSIDYTTILAECEANQIGWLAWSWGLVDNGDCPLMDMTSNTAKGLFSGLTGWGLEVAVRDKNSIKNTAKKSRYIQSFSRVKNK